MDEISADTIGEDREKDVLCELCLDENESVPAYGFCDTCNDPDYMCRSCWKRHKAYRMFKGHSVNTDLEKRPNNPQPSAQIRSKPYVENKTSDAVELFWGKFEDEKVDYYQIRFKRQKGNDKWKYCNTDDATNAFTVRGLMADTSYVFQVRSVANDIEGDYSEQSDAVSTRKSLATKMLNFSTAISSKEPVKYQLRTKENINARNTEAKTRQIILGDPSIGSDCEKTIMLVGETGSGKSTLVDGFINYILGVNFDDQFRFTLVNLESDEKKTHNQAQSQTEWITVYKISPQEGSRLEYTLNIIDTPGFGDTSGIERDTKIVDQIRHLFSANGQQGVTFIDAVCFIVKAPDSRLTAAQTYIFHSIMSLFGKDIGSNICTLITFADGEDPEVLSCLKAANLPYGTWFPFNNSALFASNTRQEAKSVSAMFWDTGCKSFHNFFETLKSFETKSLMQTKDVLQKREHLQSVLSSVQPHVDASLHHLQQLQNTLELYKKHENDIQDNKDFTYEVEILKQEKIELSEGKHVTNCLNCHTTCHKNCIYADDDHKKFCGVMSSAGNCQSCPKMCYWDQHKNAKYRFEYVTEKKKETFQNKKRNFEKAQGEKLSNGAYLKKLKAELVRKFSLIDDKMKEMTLCKNELKKIALRPDPLSTVEHINQMIQAEEINKKDGYQNRIKMLNELKQFNQIDKNVADLEERVQRVIDNNKGCFT